jgi:hypothetical protein
MKLNLQTIVLFLTCLLICSCDDNEIKDYYDTGELKNIYFKKDKKLNGDFKTYFKSGKIKELHSFSNGINVDTSYFYQEIANHTIITHKIGWGDSVSLLTLFDSLGIKSSVGKVSNEDLNKRVDKWRYTKLDRDSIVEYFPIGKRSLANQIYVVTKGQDTLLKHSNFIKIIHPKIVKVDRPFRVKLILAAPYLSYNSDVKVIVPIVDSDLREDFSNINEIERDIFNSLKNDGFSNQGIPDDVPLNQIVEFNQIYSSSGIKRIRGALVEYSELKSINASFNDSVEDIARYIYFDTTINVVN